MPLDPIDEDVDRVGLDEGLGLKILIVLICYRSPCLRIWPSWNQSVTS